MADEYKLELAGTIPEDSNIRDFDIKGRPTVELDKESPAYMSAYRIFDKIIDNK